jgi:hypothetical protein
MSGVWAAKLQAHDPEDLPHVFQRDQVVDVEADVELALEACKPKRLSSRQLQTPGTMAACASMRSGRVSNWRAEPCQSERVSQYFLPLEHGMPREATP